MNLILYEKGCFFGSILAKVNILQVRLKEYMAQIMTINFPGEGILPKQMEVKYL
jgi:hypothetical protein